MILFSIFWVRLIFKISLKCLGGWKRWGFQKRSGKFAKFVIFEMFTAYAEVKKCYESDCWFIYCYTSRCSLIGTLHPFNACCIAVFVFSITNIIWTSVIYLFLLDLLYYWWIFIDMIMGEEQKIDLYWHMRWSFIEVVHYGGVIYKISGLVSNFGTCPMHQTLSSVNVIDSCDHNMHQTFCLCKACTVCSFLWPENKKGVNNCSFFSFLFSMLSNLFIFLFNVYLGA